MGTGFDPPSGEAGEEAGGGVTSMARAAERLVRSGGADGLPWEGAKLDSHFQPILAVREPACHGYEALLRATDRDGARISPVELFERAGEASRALLDWSCRALHLRNYARIDPDDRVLFLNVHPRAAVHDANWARELANIVRYYGLSPRRLCVEILADDCGDEALLKEAVGVYRTLGVSVAVDGFGTGRSNFDRVLAVRPDVVKLDRALVADVLLGWGRSRRMLSGMVELLHEARARVVVAGIENAAEARVAVEAGADFVQGFFFSPPGPGLADEAAALERLRVALSPGGQRGLHVAS
ncbi:MAG TPA: EAL domain-containing protein [Usitatibacter sp.]|nr:EAL domain-containing protein [Usitatibacter sp.]